MFNLGKSIKKIALERGLKIATIEGHIAHFIALERVNIYQVMDADDIDAIADFFRENKTTSTKEAREHFEEKYTYGELKMVLAHLKVNG